MYTTQTPTPAERMAAIKAGPRVTAARLAAERKVQFASLASIEAAAQMIDDVYGDWCFVCSRATDHRGEHTDAQLIAWSTSGSRR